MRLYGGDIFSDYYQISEADLAKLLKKNVKAIYSLLEYLHKTEVVEYQRASDQPQITFLTPRFEMNSLPLNKQQIAWRKQVAFEKTKSVIDYITSYKTCRTRMIQQYFDEVAEYDCGVCDNCLNRKKMEEKDLPKEQDLIAPCPIPFVL